MNKIKHHWVFITLFYGIANFLILINRGIYWDDWVLYKSSFDEISKFIVRAGYVHLQYIHYFLQNVTSNPAFVYHSLTFAFGLLSTIVFYKILQHFKLSSSYLLLLTLLFAITPFNHAKITMICTPGFISLFFLLLGTYIFLISLDSSSIKRKNILLRIMALIILFLSFSFSVVTLVMWLAFLLLYSIYLQKEIEFSFLFIRKIISQLISWFDFIILPFIYWLIKSIFMQPTGILLTEGYNEITIKGLLHSPFNMIIVLLINTFGLMSESFRPIMESQSYSILFIIFFIIAYFSIKTLKLFGSDFHVNKIILLIGLYLFAAAAFPYLLIGKNPSFSGFATRGQVLLPIGTSFMLLYISSLIRSNKVVQIYFAIIISSFIIANIGAQIKYTKSWFKQESLIQHIKEDSLLVSHNNYILIDRTTDYDENERGLAHWALSGLLEKTLGHTDCFMIETKDRTTYRPDMKFQYYFLIEKGHIILKTKTVLLLLYQYYFEKEEYNNNIMKVLECKVLPVVE